MNNMMWVYQYIPCALLAVLLICYALIIFTDKDRVINKWQKAALLFLAIAIGFLLSIVLFTNYGN